MRLNLLPVLLAASIFILTLPTPVLTQEKVKEEKKLEVKSELKMEIKNLQIDLLSVTNQMLQLSAQYESLKNSREAVQSQLLTKVASALESAGVSAETHELDMRTLEIKKKAEVTKENSAEVKKN